MEHYPLKKSLIKNKEFFAPIEHILTCTICNGILQNPKQCIQCENFYCHPCIENLIVKTLYCPNKCDNSKVQNPPKVLNDLLSQLVFEGDKTYEEKLNELGKEEANNGDEYDEERKKMVIPFNNGKYEGEIWKKKLDGYGVFTWNSGQKYEGYFRNGKQYGKGKMTYPNGNVYDGEWVDDEREGECVYNWHSGQKFEGYFKKDKQHGQGKMTYSNGSIFEGFWVDGRVQLS